MLGSTLPNGSNHNVGPLHRPSIPESFYVPTLRIPLSIFEGPPRFQIGKFQDPMVGQTNFKDVRLRSTSQNTFDAGVGTIGV